MRVSQCHSLLSWASLALQAKVPFQLVLNQIINFKDHWLRHRLTNTQQPPELLLSGLNLLNINYVPVAVLGSEGVARMTHNTVPASKMLKKDRTSAQMSMQTLGSGKLDFTAYSDYVTRGRSLNLSKPQVPQLPTL